MPVARPLPPLACLAALVATSALAQSDFSSPYVPSPPAAVERMLALAKVSAGDYVFDLGSGDGRIVIAAAERYGARAMGVEFDARLVELSRRNAVRAGVAERAKFHAGDLFKADLSPATVVTVYLLPDVNLKLRDKLLGELKPGTRVVAHDFDMESWRPDHVESFFAPEKNAGRGGTSRVMLWIVPAQARGEWRLHSAALAAPGGAVLRIAQNFQVLEGDATVGDRRGSLVNPQLRGAEIRFGLDASALGAAAGPLEFVGRISGGEIAGTVRRGAGEWPWRATRAR